MRPKKKVERAKNGLMDWLAQAGVDTQTLTQIDTTPIPERVWAKSLEADGILLTLQSARVPVKAKKCKECEEVFATNYASVAYCSDRCRAKALEKIGIKWDPTKSQEERWGYVGQPSQIPIVISPEAIQTLKALYQQIVALEGNQDQNSPIQKLTELQERSYQIHNLAVREHYLSMESQGFEGERTTEQPKSEENTNHHVQPQQDIHHELFGGTSFFGSQ